MGYMKTNPFNFLGNVKRDLPKQVWSYKLHMFVSEEVQE